MKSKQFRQIGGPPKSVIQYTISKHAIYRIRNRFPDVANDRDLEKRISLLIHNSDEVGSTENKTYYQYKNVQIVVDKINKVVITIINKDKRED